MRYTIKHRFLLACLVVVVVTAMPNWSFAGFTETLPQNTFLLEETFIFSWVDSRWDENGHKAPLVEEIERYEPGGPLQGILRPDPYVENYLLVTQLQYGILDYLSVAIGIPVVLHSYIDPRISWEEGYYQSRIGRAFTEDDFWDWAKDMGQERIGTFSGNNGKLSDIILGVRYRFTDHFDVFQEAEVAMALQVFGALPTGEVADQEEVVAVGTSMWDLNSMGDLGVHLGIDKTFKEDLDGRMTLALDMFYEAFFDRTIESPVGKKYPLMRNFEPYIGETFKVNPGDFSGFTFRTDVVPFKGPAMGTWLTKGDEEKAKRFPPMFSISLDYSFVWQQQTDWKSNSQHWDYDREEDRKPGYKNYLGVKAVFSFLRVGAPFQIYCNYRTMSLIPGKNAIAADVVAAGIQIPIAFSL